MPHPKDPVAPLLDCSRPNPTLGHGAIEADYKRVGMEHRTYIAAHGPMRIGDAEIACGFTDPGYLDDPGARAAVMAMLASMQVEYADALLAALNRPQQALQ